MKKMIIALAAALLTSSAYAAVDGTPHDLSTGTIGVCQYCHMPHNALSTAGVPLWAKNLPSGTTEYTSTRVNNGGVNIIDLTSNNYSLLCMSCHAGLVGMGVLHNGQTLPLSSAAVLDANTNLGNTLANDHPVGLEYPSGGTLETQSGLVTLANAKNAGYVFFGTGVNYIECGTCHDPHRWSASAASDLYKFKRDVTATDFCAGCHATK